MEIVGKGGITAIGPVGDDVEKLVGVENVSGVWNVVRRELAGFRGFVGG